MVSYVIKQSHPINLGFHANIAYQHIKRLVGKHRQRRLATLHIRGKKAFSGKHLGKQLAGNGVVVNDHKARRLTQHHS